MKPRLLWSMSRCGHWDPFLIEFLGLFNYLPNGIEFATEDGNTCTLTAGDCITATGAKYVVVDGKLVQPASDGSGLINLAGLFAIFVLLSTFRFAGFSSRN